MPRCLTKRSANIAALLGALLLSAGPATAQQMTYFDAVQMVHKTCVDGVVIGSTGADGAAVWECRPANAMASPSTCMFVGQPDTASRDTGTLSCKP